MTVQRQSRFSGADQESVNALLQAYTVSAIEEEGNEKPFVAPGTRAERDRIWKAWTEYVFSPSFPGFFYPNQNLDIKPGPLC
jgi:hypothetical protein